MRGIRKDQITFTRFIAALAIVIFHYGRGVFPFNVEPLAFYFGNANLGVSYFFTLSGFIMMIAYAKSSRIDVFDYYRSRFARIAPAYYLALVLIMLPIIVNGWGYDKLGLFLNASMLQSWVPSKALLINTPGWSLSTELFFYALFPLLFNAVYRVRSFWLVLAIGILFFILSQYLHNYLLSLPFYKGFPSASHDFIFYFPPMHLNEFIMGNIAGLFYVKYLTNTSRANGPWIILSVAALLYLMQNPTGLSLQNGLLAIVFIPMILLICSDNGLFSKVMNLKPLIYLGEISFGIYILQMPVQILSDFLFKRIGLVDPSSIFFSYLGILIACSALSFKYIENPLRRKINGFQMSQKI
jgi:peptidoglycan/LPS O-acetylase OafA/YrhL